MEMWDCYSAERQKLGRLHPRGVPLPEGVYHLVVEVWTVNRKGEILLTKRHPDKPYGLLWEMTGGSVLAGETSREGASRELREEVGLICEPEALTYLGTVIKGHSITDLYRCDQEFEIEKLSLQPEEVVGARRTDRQELMKLIAQGEVVPHVGLKFQLFAEGILGGSQFKDETKM